MRCRGWTRTRSRTWSRIKVSEHKNNPRISALCRCNNDNTFCIFIPLLSSRSSVWLSFFWMSFIFIFLSIWISLCVNISWSVIYCISFISFYPWLTPSLYRFRFLAGGPLIGGKFLLHGPGSLAGAIHVSQMSLFGTKNKWSSETGNRNDTI